MLQDLQTSNYIFSVKITSCSSLQCTDATTTTKVVQESKHVCFVKLLSSMKLLQLEVIRKIILACQILISSFIDAL
jgi:BarA-like signal transduction histidine kinase